MSLKFVVSFVKGDLKGSGYPLYVFCLTFALKHCTRAMIFNRSIVLY